MFGLTRRKFVVDREEYTTILILIKKETIDDPEEGNVELTKETNYIPIKVKNLASIKPEQLNWKFYGKDITEAKSFLIANSKVSMLKLCHEIKINGVTFEGYKDSTSQFTILPLEGEDDSLVTVFRK